MGEPLIFPTVSLLSPSLYFHLALFRLSLISELQEDTMKALFLRRKSGDGVGMTSPRRRPRLREMGLMCGKIKTDDLDNFHRRRPCNNIFCFVFFTSPVGLVFFRLVIFFFSCMDDCTLFFLLVSRFGDSSPLDEDKALYIGSGLVLMSYLRYVTGVISDICGRLNIECFRIKHMRTS